MRQRCVRRSRLKWWGALAVGLTAALWLVSGSVGCWFVGDVFVIGINAGRLVVSSLVPMPDDFPRGWKLGGWHGWDVAYGPQWNGGRSPSLLLPVWWLPAAILLPTAWAFVCDARSARGANVRCRQCGYLRAGLTPDALCPECGARSGE